MKKSTSWASAAWETLGANASLVIGGGAATLGVALHSWPIAGAGALTSAVLFALDRAKTRTPPPVLDPHTASIMKNLGAARKELERTLGDTDPSLRADLAPLVGPIEDLLGRADGLATRSAEIGALLAQRDLALLTRECDALATRAAHAADDAVRAQYLTARATRLGHVSTLRELAAAKERIGATLLSILAAVEGLPPKIVRLRGLTSAEATRDVTRELAGMTEEIAAFERVLVQINEEVRT